MPSNRNNNNNKAAFGPIPHPPRPRASLRLHWSQRSRLDCDEWGGSLIEEGEWPRGMGERAAGVRGRVVRIAGATATVVIQSSSRRHARGEMIAGTASASLTRLPLATYAAGHPPANFGPAAAHAAVQVISTTIAGSCFRKIAPRMKRNGGGRALAMQW